MLPYLSIGRLVLVKKGEDEWGWGISINFTQKKVSFQNKQKNNAPLPSGMYHEFFNHIFILQSKCILLM